MCSVFLGLLGQCSLFLWGGSCDPEPIGQAEKWGLETSQECSINKSILILLTTPSFMICCGEMPGGWGYPHLKWMGRNQKEMELKLKWLVFTHHNQKCTARGKQHSNPLTILFLMIQCQPFLSSLLHRVSVIWLTHAWWSQLAYNFSFECD